MQLQNSPLPGPRQSLVEEASQAWQRQDYQKTIDLLERASRQQPNDCKLLLDLGEAYGLRFEYQEAERYLERAISVSESEGEVLAEAGRRCERFGQPGMANRYFKRAAQHKAASPRVLVALAEFEEGHSRMQEALELLERALHLQPDHLGARVARARLHRAAGEFAQGEKILRALLTKTTDATSAPAWYELGTILDRQGFYDQAMEAFLQAKARVRPASAKHLPDLENIRAEAREVAQGVSVGTLERWVAAGAELQPRRRWALLCGHPRSGTTLLERVLDAHPDIVASDETPILLAEAYAGLLRDFPLGTPTLAVLERASINAVRQARANYFRFTESFIGEAIGDRLLVDKNPALDVYVPMIARIFPEASFLVAIRDPRDVVLSCFMLPLPPGQLSALYLGLEETAVQYSWVMELSAIIRAKLPCPQMEIRYEQLVGSFEPTARSVLDFLGVEWNPGVLRHADHARTTPLRSGIDDSVAKPVFASSVGRWRNYQKYLEPCIGQLAPFIKTFGYE